MKKNRSYFPWMIQAVGAFWLFVWTTGVSQGSSTVPPNNEVGSRSNQMRGESEGSTPNILQFPHESPSIPAHRRESSTILTLQSYNILLLIADNDQPNLRSTLAAFPDIANVDYFDARPSTPTLAQLAPYDAVIAWPNSAFSDKITTGDVLATYVDGGGAVVTAAWCWFLDGNDLGGEIMSPSYNPYTGLGGNHLSVATLGWYDANHPIMDGVSSVSDIYRDSLTLNRGILSDQGAVPVAKWDDGEWFVGTMGRVVGVNAVPGDGFGWSGDLITLFHNALIWAIDQGPPQYAIFQDRNPWGYTMNQGILNSNGISYRVYDASLIGSMDISPFTKVIIASQQDNTFYTTVSMNRSWFESYAGGGGILEFHGATFIVDDWAGLTMPGNFTGSDQSTTFSDTVSIQIPTHPIVTTPNSITDSELDDWDYSTHGYLISFGPTHTEILRNDPYNEPSLVEFPWGGGVIIATLNALEWGHGLGYSWLLENVLLYRPPTTGVEEEPGSSPPRIPHLLAQNHPNPFSRMTTIDYHLSVPGEISLRIFDLSGQLVKTLFEGVGGAGTQRVTWDGRDERGRAVSTGVYFYRLKAGDFTSTRKLILFR
ncbi:T9SS type A sorting domain-containing protein [candidate division TA06 bacterium]|nr:T9SS type A sorting domain-containing protein [candidate division TA06 bacterium]